MVVSHRTNMSRRCLHLALLGAASACSDWIMDDAYGLSVRTMDLGDGPSFSLRTQPRGHKAAVANLPPAKYGHIISVGANVSHATKLQQHVEGTLPTDDMAFAGLNEAGLSCDLHALLNSSYPPLSTAVGKKNIMLYYFCNWALAQFDTAAAVKAALSSGGVHLWGPAAMEDDGVHFVVRDSTGRGLAVEFMDKSTLAYDDLNDGETGVGVFTNEPPFPWQLANVRHYRWKQSLARPATAMPGAWYPDERFLRVYLTKSAMPAPASYQEAVQHALRVSWLKVPSTLFEDTAPSARLVAHGPGRANPLESAASAAQKLAWP